MTARPPTAPRKQSVSLAPHHDDDATDAAPLNGGSRAELELIVEAREALQHFAGVSPQQARIFAPLASWII